jgi:hypothetical protein
MPSKYSFEQMLPIFRMATLFRNKAKKAGFTDNGGAIHSAARILEIMAQRVKYPGLNHGSGLRKYAGAEFSEKAWAAFKRGEATYIEHVSPTRHFTLVAIQMLIDDKCSEAKFKAFLLKNYRLVVITKDEAKTLDGINRSKMAPKRLEDAGIKVTRRTSMRSTVK